VDASFGVRNVGYHSTVLLAPEVMASDGATALQLPGQVIPEGGDIGFEQPLRFSGAGSRRVATAVVASNLGKTAVKLVPNPDGSPAETVTIAVLPPPEIAPVVSDCTPWGVAGEVTEFQVRNRDAIGGALTYNWSSDAGIGSDPHQPTFRLELPAAVGQRVRISCSVSRPDGCVVEGGTTLVTVAPEAADFSRLICELAKSPGFRHLGRGKLVDQGDGYRTGEPIPLTEITGLRDLLAKAAEAANSVLTTEKVSAPVLTAQPSLATVAQPR
jgi:hypothetical protein